MSPPEIAVWNWLRKGQVEGLKVRRNCPLGPFIADFYIHALRLVIEIDGKQHAQERVAERDRGKEARYAEAGISVLRMSAQSILADPAATRTKLERVLRTLLARRSAPNETAC